jgi:flagellar biosynthesis/type III secretory pathway protein FliH
LVSYDLSEREYTTIRILPNSADRYAEREKAEEEERRAQRFAEKEEQLRDRTREAEKKAAAILQSAEKKAGEILRRAEAAAAGIQAEAEKAGYRDGRRAAEEETRARLSKQAEALEHLILEAGTARETMLEELEGEIITLVMETAKKVINIELERDDTLFMELVRNALGKMKKEGKLILRVSSEDYASLFSAGSAEFIIDNEHIRTTVIEEPLFRKGDCVIDSEGETVNAGISSQLRYIEYAFRNAESCSP